jgi:NAD(P)-dependent dehydrogenase (short-subunit alcohol dehydrogenase family)
MLETLKGEWAVVTGGASGIGLALAEGFAGIGMHVVLADILAEEAQAAAATLSRSMGVHVRAEAVDVTEPDTLVALAGRLAADGIDPAVVWANAGVGVGATLVEAPRRVIEWAVSANILSVAWTAQAFAPRLRMRSGPRHFGITASTASLVDVRGPYTLYAATKQGTAGFAEALAAEMAPQGVAVTLLYPGLLNTNIWNGARARPDRFGGTREMPQEAGATWRAAPGPEVLVGPVLMTMAGGGGRCIVDPTGEARDLMDARHAAIAGAFTLEQAG